MTSKAIFETAISAASTWPSLLECASGGPEPVCKKSSYPETAMQERPRGEEREPGRKLERETGRERATQRERRDLRNP